MLIPQIVGFCQTKILQSGEFSLISFNLRKIRFQIQIQIPQIVGFCCTKNIQSGEFPLITYNLRNSPFSFQVQIPQKTYRVGNFLWFPSIWGIFRVSVNFRWIIYHFFLLFNSYIPQNAAFCLIQILHNEELFMGPLSKRDWIDISKFVIPHFVGFLKKIVRFWD